MNCFDQLTKSSVAYRQGSHHCILGGTVSAPAARVNSIQIINVGFNDLTAVAVRSNG